MRDLRAMLRVLMIGTGRLAFHLAHALTGKGINPVGIVGRDPVKAAALAAQFHTPYFGLADELPFADLRILAVKDDAIGMVAQRLHDDGSPLVHLAGSQPLELLIPHSKRGVLWPIQSFSPGDPVDFAQVPIVIDAADEGTLALVQQLAEMLSPTVVQLGHEQRQWLHLAAVFSSNFPVFLLREAERVLHTKGINPELVHPLWEASTQKALQDADQAVTGPARRGDVGTMAKHLTLLAADPDLRRAYAALSDLIYHTYHPTRREQ